jgi:FkbM family methyltransferase
MSASSYLSKHPFIFDITKAFARKVGRRTELFDALDSIIPVKQAFTFLQIGANDGISCDPYREFMIRKNASGVAMEPVPAYFVRLQANYARYPRVTCVQAAAGYPARDNSLFAYTAAYLATRENASFLQLLASFTRRKLEAALLPGEDPHECIEEILVPTFTIESVLDRTAFQSFDCLFMDCEGNEENILLNLDYKRVNPKIIVYEHTHLAQSGEEVTKHLATQGFTAREIANDTVAVHHSLVARLSCDRMTGTARDAAKRHTDRMPHSRPATLSAYQLGACARSASGLAQPTPFAFCTRSSFVEPLA